MSKAVLIANPASGRGRGAKLLPRARAAFARAGITDVRVTARSGDESHLTRAAIDDGATTIAVLGGDGTWGRCAAAVADAGAGSRVRLAFLSAGTGNDFAKNLDAPTHDPDAMARLCAQPGEGVPVDLGRAESGGAGHWFLNVIGFGFDVSVLEEMTRGGRLGGSAVYVVTALRQLLRYEGFDVALNGAPAARTMMLTVSNGLNFGGAFRIAPAARVDDGLLDLVAVADVRGLARVPLFLRAVRGAHLSHPRVLGARGAEFTLTFAGPPRLEVDGELRQAGAREVRVRCVPRALRAVTSR